MARFLKKRIFNKNSIPGEAVFIGDKKVENVSISFFKYNQDDLVEKSFTKDNPIKAVLNSGYVNWINVNGLHDVDFIKHICEDFNVDSMIVDDIVNTGQRNRVEEFDDYIFITSKMLYYDDITGKIKNEHLCIVAGRDFIITFQERPGDVFESIRNRIRGKKGRIRNFGSDYLLFCLLDAVFNNYFNIIEGIGNKIENIEEKILNEHSSHLLNDIKELKRELIFLRKILRPSKEYIARLPFLKNNVITKKSLPFFNDLVELITQVVEAADSYKDLLSDVFDVYNSEINNRLNEIMKILTIFSAIFIPLTFVAGIYGMNFEYMPELSFKYSYFVIWVVLIVIAVAMVTFFKKKKWF